MTAPPNQPQGPERLRREARGVGVQVPRDVLSGDHLDFDRAFERLLTSAPSLLSVAVEDRPDILNESDPVVRAGLQIAMKWGNALGGSEQLRVALKALEPQLKREHELQLRRLAAQHAAAIEHEARLHRFRMIRLIVGSVMSILTLGAGVYVAQDAWWLAVLLCAPGLTALLKISFVRNRLASSAQATGQEASVPHA